MTSRGRRIAAEALGTALLVAAVIGSGIMAARLATDPAVALLANTLATGGVLYALISGLGPISGAHLNPVVSAVAAWDRELSARDAVLYIGAQLAGGAAGAILANLMFELPAVTVAATARHGTGQLLAEAVATFGLVAVIATTARRRPTAVAAAVAGYIVGGYWFTASTSFANPAVTVARTLSDTYAGIRPADAPGFIAAQLVGGAAAAALCRWLVPPAPADT